MLRAATRTVGLTAISALGLLMLSPSSVGAQVDPGPTTTTTSPTTTTTEPPPSTLLPPIDTTTTTSTTEPPATTTTERVSTTTTEDSVDTTEPTSSTVSTAPPPTIGGPATIAPTTTTTTPPVADNDAGLSTGTIVFFLISGLVVTAFGLMWITWRLWVNTRPVAPEGTVAAPPAWRRLLDRLGL